MIRVRKEALNLSRRRLNSARIIEKRSPNTNGARKSVNDFPIVLRRSDFPTFFFLKRRREYDLSKMDVCRFYLIGKFSLDSSENRFDLTNLT